MPEETTMTRDDLYKMIGEQVSSAVQDVMGKAKDDADKKAADDKQAETDNLMYNKLKEQRMKERSPKEQRIARVGAFVRTLAAAKCNPDEALKMAKDAKDFMTEKALAETSFSTGGALISTEFSAEVIEALYARTVVRGLGAESVPMDNGSMTMPYVSSGSTATWTGEAAANNATTLTYGQINLRAKELIALVPVSNKLLRHSSYNVNTIVGNDLIRSLGTAEDAAFIRGAGSAATPEGIRYQTSSTNIFTQTKAGATVTAKEAAGDMGKCIYLVEDADIDIMRGGWMMAPRTKKALFNAMDSNSNYIWRDEMKNGTLLGFPFDYTTSIPRNISSTDSELYFCDFSLIVIGEDQQIAVETFDGAAYVNSSGSVVSGVSQNQTVLRAIAGVDIGMRQRGLEASIISDIDWDELA